MLLKRATQNNRRIIDEVKRFSSLVGSGSKIEGRVFGNDNYVVEGHIIGDGEIDGTVVIGEQGLWEGTLEAFNVVVAGAVRGNVVARNKLELTKTAKVTGGIQSPVVAIAEGAVHQGEMRMTKNVDVVHFEEKRQD